MSVVASVRPAYRPYEVQVASVKRLSPHFVRVEFTGPDMEHFGTAGLDQRIKVVLPFADGTFADFGQHEAAGDWYDRWRNLPDDARNVFRTYTVRRIEPGRLTVDFVVHDHAGPAGAWAEQAAVGQDLFIVGPDERSPNSRGGIDWHPGTARRVLLAGDETAAPAICSILESLDLSYQATAFIEVPEGADAGALGSDPRIRVIARGAVEHGTGLIEAVTAWAQHNTELLELAKAPVAQELEDIDIDAQLLWDSPGASEGEFYAWFAGEAATIKSLRRLLVSGHGVDRKRVSFMGYWRQGRAEASQ